MIQKALVSRALLGCITATCMVGCGSSNSNPQDSNDDKNDSLQSTPIDRVGRPEITNFTMRDPAIKVAYNGEDTFNLSDKKPVYAGYIGAGIQAWDSFDGKVDWAEDALAGLVEWLVADFLIVDVSKPCIDEGNLLSIERSLALGTSYDSCGGRTLDEDAIDTYVTILIAGFDAEERYGDGVDAPAELASKTFPYLAKPVPPPAEEPSE